jgi:hypothetical protein
MAEDGVGVCRTEVAADALATSGRLTGSLAKRCAEKTDGCGGDAVAFIADEARGTGRGTRFAAVFTLLEDAIAAG